MYKLNKLSALGAFALMGMGAAILPAAATTLAYDFSATPSSSMNSAALGLGYGFEFTVTSDTTVTGLGTFDNGLLSNNGLGDTGDTVYLGSGTLPTTNNVASQALASTQITPSSTPMGSALCGDASCWAFNSLAKSLVLDPGTTYWILTIYGNANGVFPSGPAAQISTSAVTTEAGVTLTSGVNCGESTACNTTSTDTFGPNFETAATPLPAALPLFAGGLGLMGLLGWRRKRKAAALASA